MLSVFHLYSQHLDGVVTDNWGSPIEQAHVSCGKEIAITDLNGVFSIPIPEDTISSITVSAVGYKVLIVSGVKKSSQSPLIVVLDESIYALGRVEVVAETPYQVLSRAITKSLSSLPEMEATAFYRQTHQENGRYVRLIEADVTVQHDKNIRTNDKMKINQLRRSLVYELNGDKHGDHIADLLEENLFFNPRGTVMDLSVLKQFELIYSTDSVRPWLTVIKYTYESGQDPKIRTGKVFIDTAGYIIEITERTSPNPLCWPGGSLGNASDTHWDFREGEKRIVFTFLDDHLMPVKITQTYLHHISDRYSGVVRYHLVETFELCYGSITSGTATCEGLKVHGGLYGMKYQYNPDFWSQYQPLLQYPLDNQVKSDLEAIKPLENQFEEAGR